MIPKLWARLNAEKSYGQKTSQKSKITEVEMRGLKQNQINTLIFTYQNDQRNNICLLSDCGNETPTHIDATHAFSKILQNFQNRIPRELNQNLYISRIGINH